MYELIIITMMLMLNAIFAAYEIGIASISYARIKSLTDSRKKGAQDALFMKERIEGSFATVQIGITVAGMIAAAAGGAAVEENLTPFLQANLSMSEHIAEMLALFLFVVPLSVITIIFGELTPKIFAIRNNEKVVLLLSPVMIYLYKIFYPFILVIEKIVKKVVSPKINESQALTQESKMESLRELKTAVSIAKASRLIGKHEERIVLSAAQLSMRTVHDIMLDAPDMTAIWAGSSISDAFIKAHKDMHTRFPVCEIENNLKSISGYINFKDILSVMKTGSKEPTIKAIVRPIKRVEDTMVLSKLLEIMVQGKIHIALVENSGTVLGMVTLEDILEELVGEIGDEYDLVPSSIKPYGSSWITGGNISMELIVSTLGVEIPINKINDRAENLSEWCTRQLGYFPKGGETIEVGRIQVIPRKFRRKKMIEAIVSVIGK